MSVAFQRLRVYVRAILIICVVVVVGLVLFKNRNHEVSFWFLWLTDDTRKINVIWLMLCTAAGTLLLRWALSRARGLWRELREVKRLTTLEKVTAGLDKRAVELNERERRIDEQLRSAIADDEQTDD